MAVSTIALYASPSSSVCSTPHPCHMNEHASYDFELGNMLPMISSPASTATVSTSTSTKPVMGGLSCLFSSPAVVKHHTPLSSSFFGAGEEDELKELSSSFSYSPSKFGGSSWKRDQSPVSVFQCLVSCSSNNTVRSMRSTSGSGFFDGFVRSALGSCLDYDSTGLNARGAGGEFDGGDSSSRLVDEWW